MKSLERLKFWNIIITILCNGGGMGTRGLRVGVRLCSGSQRTEIQVGVVDDGVWWSHWLVCEGKNNKIWDL